MNCLLCISPLQTREVSDLATKHQIPMSGGPIGIRINSGYIQNGSNNDQKNQGPGNRPIGRFPIGPPDIGMLEQ